MQLSQHIHALRIPFQVPVAPDRAIDRFVYVFLVYAREICLIDTGVSGAEQAIYAYLEKTGRKREEITRIVLTHSHPDHIGAACSIARATGAAVLAHPAERAWIEDTQLQARERPIPGFSSLVSGSVPLSGLLEQGDRVDLGDGVDLAVLHTPGHSSGSISLHLPEERALVVGDAVPLPMDFPIYVDAPSSLLSVEALRQVAPVDLLLSAWDEPRRGEDVRRVLETAAWHLKRMHHAVWEVVEGEGERDPARVARRVFERFGAPGLGANPLTARSVQAHLEAGPVLHASANPTGPAAPSHHPA